MSIQLTHTEAQAVVLLQDAIRACNALVIFTKQHHNIFPEPMVKQIIEGDFLINTAQDYVVNDDPDMFYGAFDDECGAAGGDRPRLPVRR